MPLGDRLRYAANRTRVMKEILASWKPSDLKDARRKTPKSEKGWENSLVEHLRGELPDFNIVPQGGAGMLRGDITIEGKAFMSFRDIVELKQGMSSTPAYQKLLGQIQVYRKEKGFTFVVICGEDVDAKLIQSLKSLFKNDYDKLAIFWKKSQRRGVDLIAGLE